MVYWIADGYIGEMREKEKLGKHGCHFLRYSLGNSFQETEIKWSFMAFIKFEVIGPQEGSCKCKSKAQEELSI